MPAWTAMSRPCASYRRSADHLLPQELVKLAAYLREAARGAVKISDEGVDVGGGLQSRRASHRGVGDELGGGVEYRACLSRAVPVVGVRYGPCQSPSQLPGRVPAGHVRVNGVEFFPVLLLDRHLDLGSLAGLPHFGVEVQSQREPRGLASSRTAIPRLVRRGTGRSLRRCQAGGQGRSASAIFARRSSGVMVIGQSSPPMMRRTGMPAASACRAPWSVPLLPAPCIRTRGRDRRRGNHLRVADKARLLAVAVPVGRVGLGGDRAVTRGGVSSSAHARAMASAPRLHAPWTTIRLPWSGSKSSRASWTHCPVVPLAGARDQDPVVAHQCHRSQPLSSGHPHMSDGPWRIVPSVSRTTVSDG